MSNKRFVIGLIAVLILALGISALEMEEINSAIQGSRQEELALNEWLVVDLSAGETLTIDFSVTQGNSYALYVVDDYNADRHGASGVENPIEAVWFMVLQADNVPYDPDSEPAQVDYDYAEHTSLYDAVGGYTPDGSRAPAANFSALGQSIRVYIEGSKTNYAGQVGIRLERSR